MFDAGAVSGTTERSHPSPVLSGVHFSTAEIKRRIDAMFDGAPSDEVQAGEH
ncbi:hypothetical protein [Rhodococcus sp. SJ-2]